MVSINMRLFKSTLLLLSLLLLTFLPCQIRCLPLEESTTLSSSLLSGSSGDHYDQRQNGTDNYRIHVDGVVVVVAPVEALLLAGGAATAGTNQSDISFLESALQSTPKPDSKPSLENLGKPISSPKSTHRSSLRLINLLAPFIRRLHQKE